MRYIILILLLLTGTAYGQTVLYTGATTQATIQKGGYGADILMLIPNDTNIAVFPTARKNGRIAVKNGVLYAYDTVQGMWVAPTGGGGGSYLAGYGLILTGSTFRVDSAKLTTRFKAYTDSLALAGQIVDSQTAMYNYISTLISNYYTKTQVDNLLAAKKDKSDSTNFDGYVPVNRWSKHNIVVEEELDTKYNTADTVVFKNKGDTVNPDGYVTKNKAQKDSASWQAKFLLETFDIVAARGAFAARNIELRGGTVSGVNFLRRLFFGGFDGTGFAANGPSIGAVSYGAWTTTDHRSGIDETYVPNGSITPLISRRTDGYGNQYFSNSAAALANVVNPYRFNFNGGPIYSANSVKTPDTVHAGNITIKSAANTTLPSTLYGNSSTNDTLVQKVTLSAIASIMRDSLNIRLQPALSIPVFTQFSGGGSAYQGSFYGNGFWTSLMTIGANADGGFIIKNFHDSAQNAVVSLDTIMAVSGYTNVPIGITFNSTSTIIYDANGTTVIDSRAHLGYMIYRTTADSTYRLYYTDSWTTWTLAYTFTFKTNKLNHLTVRGVTSQMVPRLTGVNLSCRILILGNSTEAMLYGFDSVGKTVFTPYERMRGYGVRNIAVGGNPTASQMAAYLALSQAERQSFSAVYIFTGLNSPDIDDTPSTMMATYQLLIDTIRSQGMAGGATIACVPTPVKGALSALRLYHLLVMRGNIMGTGANPALRVTYRVRGHFDEMATVEGGLLNNFQGLDDGIHLNSEGKRVIDKWVADAAVKCKVLLRQNADIDSFGLFNTGNQTAVQLNDLAAIPPAIGTSAYCTDCSPAVTKTWNGSAWVGGTTLTTTGTSGPATYNPTTGVLNIPQYTGGGGGSTPSVMTVAASTYNVVATSGENIYLLDCTANNITVSLPTAVANTAILTFKKIDSGANTPTIEADGSETIDGDADQQILFQNTVFTIVSDGSDWYIIN